MADRSSRTMDILQIGVLFLFVLYNMPCLAIKTCTEASTPHSQGVCGKLIPELLSMICDGKYREKEDIMKRSPVAGQNILDMGAKEVLDLAKQAQLSDDTDNEEGSFYEKRDASMFLQKRGNYYFTGISCECCYHHCRIGELANYCKYPKKAMKNLLSLGMLL